MRMYSHSHHPELSFVGPAQTAIEAIEGLAQRRANGDPLAYIDFELVERLWDYRITYDRAQDLFYQEVRKGRSDMRLVWDHLDTMLSVGARSSRMFWPEGRNPKRSYVERAARMRSYYEDILEPALKDKSVRNGIEHFDETVGDWIDSHPRFNRIEGMGPISTVGDREWVYRFIDTDTSTFYFADRSVDLIALEQAMDLVADRSQHIKLVVSPQTYRDWESFGPGAYEKYGPGHPDYGKPTHPFR